MTAISLMLAVPDAAAMAASTSRAEETGALGTVALRDGHPVAAAVLDAVGRRALRSIGTVRFRATADERLTGLVAELAAAGLLRRAHLRRTWLPTDAGRTVLRGGYRL